VASIARLTTNFTHHADLTRDFHSFLMIRALVA